MNCNNKMEDMILKPTIIDVLDINNTTKDIQIVKPLEKDEVPIYFTEDELLVFFKQIPSDKFKHKVLFLTLLGTGQRISEILSVKKNDIDLQNRRLRIISLKKRKRKIRYIGLHPDIAYNLSVYVGSLKADDKVFSYSRQYADDLIKKYAKKASITYKRTSCHIFRHTFAIRWLEQEQPIHKLQRMLDHSHITTTMRYLQVVNKDLYDTVDKLDILSFMK